MLFTNLKIDNYHKKTSYLFLLGNGAKIILGMLIPQYLNSKYEKYS